MNPNELKEHLEEMFDQLEQLPHELQNDIEGFALIIKIGEKIGCNMSNNFLDLPIDERCNLVSMLLHKLNISPDEFNIHIQTVLMDMSKKLMERL